jgi:hypothetical protein
MNSSSMLSSSVHTSHSAEVEMYIAVKDTTLSIAQLGPDFFILEHEPTAIPPSTAEIALSIDGDVDRFSVELPAGLIAGEKRARFIVLQ